MRVALLAQDEAAAACLAPLAAKGCQVLGVGVGGDPCPFFGKRCMELGFDFTWSSRNLEVAKFAVDLFEPELLLCVPGGVVPPPFAGGTTGPPAYAVRLGSASGVGPWPEFAPIWLEHKASRVSLVACPSVGVAGAEVLSREVPVSEDETAVSLRAKHVEAAAELIAALLDAGPASQPAAATELEAPMDEDGAEEGGEGAMPERISLDWDDAEVDRFLRARLLPPRSPAEVVNPSNGEAYFIENLPQYHAFRAKVLGDSSLKTAAAEDKPKLYAADTHWYSNISGSIVKVSDQSIHAPRRVADGHFRMVIPGASVGTGAREKLRMNEPLIGPNAERYCSSVLASGWIGVEGPFVKRFEAHIANICGCSAACAVQSGTAALYGAMKALGVSDPTHHVLCPAFTCAACADAVVHAGGTPIPIDCELDTYSISASAVKNALQNNPHVVGVVTAPCYGVPTRDIYSIIELCKERGLWLCEDACESYGATMHANPLEGAGAAPVPLGSLATLSVVSVRSEKMVGVGEGGAIVGNDMTLVARARWWCSRAPCRGGGLWRVYEHEGVGQNFRLPEMLAAVGCAAAEMLPTMIERKRAIHSWYETHIVRPGLDGVKLQASAPGDNPVWWLNAALLPEGISAEEVGMNLMKEYPDIEIRPGFFPLDQMAIFAGAAPAPCANTDLLFRRLVCLPSSSLLKEAHVERICGALADSLSTVAAKVATRTGRGVA